MRVTILQLVALGLSFFSLGLNVAVLLMWIQLRKEMEAEA